MNDDQLLPMVTGGCPTTGGGEPRSRVCTDGLTKIEEVCFSSRVLFGGFHSGARLLQFLVQSTWTEYKPSQSCSLYPVVKSGEGVVPSNSELRRNVERQAKVIIRQIYLAW